MTKLPPEAKPGELSIREKAVEMAPGVYVTKMRTRPVRLGGRAAISTEYTDDIEVGTIPPEFLEGLSEADATLTIAFYDALMARNAAADILLPADSFSVEEQLGNSARTLLETARQQFDYWAQFSTNDVERVEEAIIGPVTESLSLTPEEVEQAHAVVSVVEAERQARQASGRRPRQELFPSKAPSEAAVALRAMIAAREEQKTADAQFEEDSRNLPQRHMPRGVHGHGEEL